MYPAMQAMGTMENEKVDFDLKEISPSIGANSMAGNGGITTLTDLVEVNHFLFVRIVRARYSLGVNVDAYVEVTVGGFKGTTLCFMSNSGPEWNQVFAIDTAQIQVEETTLEIFLKGNNFRHVQNLGHISFDISDIPTRFASDSDIAPQWYGLEDQRGLRCRGELMLSTWLGTQADGAFPEAWHLQLDGAASSIGVYNFANTLSRIYLMPGIWCLRVSLIQAHDLLLVDRTEMSQLFIRATLGNLAFSSKLVKNNNGNPEWNEDMLIAVAEPFDQILVLSVEQGTFGSHRSLGVCVFPVKNADMRVDDSPPSTTTLDVNRHGGFAGRLDLRVSLDGGYHVFEEDMWCCSDMNPAARNLWMPRVGVFEMGILNATGVPAMKPVNRTDAYCVAKYGTKWVRTRTVLNSLCPRWNEQYSWDVYDPCTFITICVFDNGQLHQGGVAAGAMDTRIGKVRICLSELETNRIYCYSYPLVELQPSGLKTMGEIQLAFRFCSSDMISLWKVYTSPMLPIQHFTNPLSQTQLYSLRKQAIILILSKMNKTELPLRREVVEYMLDSRETVWSIRRGRADFERIYTFLSGLIALYAKFDEICMWINPISTLIFCMVLFIMVFHPQLWLPAFFSYVILHVLQQHQKRPRAPSHVDLQLSHVHTTSIDELEEEFDPFPSRFGDNIIRHRYDRLRVVAGKCVASIGNLATTGERFQSLLSWQDPVATILVMMLCLITGILTLVVPFQSIFFVWILYLLRHPILRSHSPSLFENWFRRMPSKLDSMI
ncbi:hypothetical protein RJT34_10699 [Clitoria ternatea]|uniref:C2 domain-containing protein n=1 Tax=Clitoria ternatea TaxID=43366 RepID=A0AAN9PIS2_CLITE